MKKGPILISSVALVVLGVSLVFALRRVSSPGALATFVVATEEKSLQAYVNRPIVAEVEPSFQDARRIRFTLPAEVLGEAREFVLEPLASNPLLWTGEGANGLCEKVAGGLDCQLQFPELVADQSKALAAIDAGMKDAGEAAGRRAIAEQFLAEPLARLVLRQREP